MTTPIPVSRAAALRSLDFGSVDSESEADLDRRFVRTSDFDRFLRPNTWIALGAKGTGKSALFELLTKYEATARELAPVALSGVWITAGTGFSDLSEVATGDISDLRGEDGYDHEQLWRLYIAIRAGLAVKDSTHIPDGALKDLLRAIGEVRDLRLGPLLKKLWRALVGAPPRAASVTVRGVTIDLSSSTQTIDVLSLLQDVQATLEHEDKKLWVLFDKIDELFPADRDERLRTLEGLLTASMSLRRTFPRILPKIFLRTDLWRSLNFTNKSHLSDKRIELRWNRDQIAALLLKRATSNPAVWELVAETEETLLEVPGTESLSANEVQHGLEAIFPPSAYPGQNEALFVDWLVARVTDGLGTVLPREAIFLGNRARELQEEAGSPAAGDSLIGREAVRAAFRDTSQMRCSTYLAEFPTLSNHFKRFEGQTTSVFSRIELEQIMAGLDPHGDDMIREFCEIGLMEPVGGDVSTANGFEIPRLYRVGLGLVIRGRP